MIQGLFLGTLFGLVWGLFFSRGNDERPLTKSDLEDILNGDDDNYLAG